MLLIDNISYVLYARTDPSGHAVLGVGLRPLACWDSAFEISQGRGFLSIVRLCVVRVLYVGLITRPEGSYRLWCV